MTHQLSWELQNRIIRWAFDTQLNMVALNDATTDRKSTRLNSSHVCSSRMPSSA